MTITSRFLRCTSVALIVAVTASPVLSAPTVIAQLGRAPLLGPNMTLKDLQISIARNEDRLAAAAQAAGLSAAEYRAFRVATQTQRPDWGRVPRRLNAMTWYSGGQVHVIRDVEIPAGTYGFEYDESGPAERLRIYLPVACGNLSILRERIRRAAAHKPPMAVSAIPPHIVAPTAPAPPATAPAVGPEPAPSPTTLPTVYLGSQPSRGFFPFIATLFGFLVIGGGGHKGGGSGGGGGCGCTKNP